MEENLPRSYMDWLRTLWRAVRLLSSIIIGLGVFFPLRLIEAITHGTARPWTPFIVQWVCKMALRSISLPLVIRGDAMPHHGVIVANHVSWLDIFTIGAATKGYFVSKSEVHGWFGIGFLARITGTVFIARKGTDAKRQQEVFRRRLCAGHRLIFFPEGTSTDAVRVLPFKSTLFAGLFAPEFKESLYVQPISLAYKAPITRDSRYYGWWGDMEFLPDLVHVLSTRHQGRVEVTLHPPLAISDFADRKALAAECERIVRSGL